MIFNHLMHIFWPGDEKELISRDFRAGEFKSKRSKAPWFVSSDMVYHIQAMRSEAEVAFRINSGYRTPRHNTNINGASKSRHMMGLAADIAIPKGMTNFELAGLAYAVGFRRIGVASTFVHVDMAPGEACWTYGSLSKDGLWEKIQAAAKKWSDACQNS